MVSKLERIYANLPVCLQNMAVSMQGWIYNRRRYGKAFNRHFAQLMKSQWLSADQFENLQVCRLRKLLREAIENVPYYRDSLEKFSGNVDLINLDNLRDIPIVESEDIRRGAQDFVNSERLKLGYDIGHTSGTSGSPILVKYDSESMQHNLAFRSRLYRWAGITGKEKSARFSGKPIMGVHNGPPYWRYNMPENQLLFSVYHLDGNSLSDYYEALIRHKIVYLDGYVSALFAIAKWINDHGQSSSWRPWVIITTAEMLMDFQREEIEKAFGCRVFNFYSSSEGAPFITQCPAGRMHLNPESGIVELLRLDDEYAEPGEEARMVVTSFFQRTMPLIRYSIGDTATLAEDQACPCGRQMPVIKHIGGRESDTLYSTERGPVGSTAASTIHNAIPWRIMASQIEQVDIDSFVFRYISNGEALNEAERTTILEEFHKRLGNSIEVTVELVDAIPKGPNGKSRLIISLCDSRRRKSKGGQ